MYILPWALASALCFQPAAATHVLQRRMEALPAILNTKSAAKAAAASDDIANLIHGGSAGSETGLSGSHSGETVNPIIGLVPPGGKLKPPLPKQLQRVNAFRGGGSLLPDKNLPKGLTRPKVQLTRQKAQRYDASLAPNQLTRQRGQRFPNTLPKTTRDEIAKEEVLKKLQDAANSQTTAESSHHPSEHIPKSLERFRATDHDYDQEDWESYSGRFEHSVHDIEPAKYEPMYLSVILEDPKSVLTNPKDLVKLTKEIQRTGEILVNLSADEKLRQTVDIDFMVREFRESWLKKIPPEHRDDAQVLKEIDRVSKTLTFALQSAEQRARTEKAITAAMKPWRQFEGKLPELLEKSLPVYIKDQSDKNVMSQLENRLQNWNSEEVRQTAKSMTTGFLTKIDDEDLIKLHQVNGLPAPRRGPSKLFDLRGNRLEKLLNAKLMNVPQPSDDEFRFIYKEISALNYAKLMSRSNKERMRLTPEAIAASGEITTKQILDLKLQFTVLKPLEQEAESTTKAQINLLFTSMVDNRKLMEDAYKEKVFELTHDTNAKVEAQLFKKNYDIDLSSDEMYYKLKDLGNAWKVDLEAFANNFKKKLSPEEFSELSQAASRSKLLYNQVLDSIQETRKIDRFKFLEEEILINENDKDFPQSVQKFLDELSGKKIVYEGLCRQLRAASTTQESAKTAVDTLREYMQIDVFEKLAIESLPQLDLSSATSSITEFLDELMTKKLITPEERNYLYPVKVPSDATPISLIQDFSAKIDKLRQLPLAFEERVQGFLLYKLGDISTTDEVFLSKSVTSATEEQIALQNSRIDELLKKGDYSKVLNNLRPSSIKNSIREDVPQEYWAKELWNDHFKREYPAYNVLPIDRIKAKQGRVRTPKVADSAELIDGALTLLKPQREDQLPKSQPHGGPSGASSSNPPEKGKGIDKLTIPPDERHFALLLRPLTPAKENTAGPLKLADERFKDSPFRYLSKDAMDEWNASVQYVFSKMNQINQDIGLRIRYAKRIQRNLDSLGPYRKILPDLLGTVNSKFSTSDSRYPGLYKLTPEADDARVQDAFAGPSFTP